MWLLLAIAILVGVVALTLDVYGPSIKGKLGENYVSGQLSRLDPAHYQVIDDLMVLSGSTIGTSQIDHVVISNFGIFVIETKAYQGWIFGDARQSQWTQVIYRHRERFYNPLRQNYGHVKALEALIHPLFPGLPILGFVAFPSAERIKVSGTNAVGQTWQILEKIGEYRKPIISNEQRFQVYDLLLHANIEDKEQRHNHVVNARARKYLRDSMRNHLAYRR